MHETGLHSSSETAARLHREAIILDMVSPLFVRAFPCAVDEYLAGGVTAIGATIFDPLTPDLGTAVPIVAGDAAGALRGVAHIYALIRQLPDTLMLIEALDDFARDRQAGKLGIVLHSQTCAPFQHDLNFVELFYRLGVRVALLAYNTRNLFADGCTERTNAGLSKLGVRLIREMNRVGIVIDGSHTGERSTLDAMEVCEAPFIFSHSGCKALHDHPRNITDEQIRRCVATGGMVGVVGLPNFLGDHAAPKLETVVRHVAHIAELVGAEHAGIGMDYFTGLIPYSTYEEQLADYPVKMSSGLWGPGDMPPPPWRCAPEIETPAGMRHLTAALLEHGFSEAETRGIMGENFLRVFGQVWKPVGGAPSDT